VTCGTGINALIDIDLLLFTHSFIHIRHVGSTTYYPHVPSVICWRGSSASPLCMDIIACCPTHPSFNRRRNRDFPVAASRLWNILPLNVTLASSISVFRKHLKTHLFSHSFPESPVVPVQCLCHFGHYNRSCYYYYYYHVFQKRAIWHALVLTCRVKFIHVLNGCKNFLAGDLGFN